jgi:hypothetical protein
VLNKPTKTIQVSLDADTAEFLDIARHTATAATISDFINSLLRQERFRQGFPAYQGQGHPNSVLSLAKKILDKRHAH